MNYLSKQFVGGLACFDAWPQIFPPRHPTGENPSVFAVNKEAPRATSLPYKTSSWL
jgi:beta-galactosidase